MEVRPSSSPRIPPARQHAPITQQTQRRVPMNTKRIGAAGAAFLAATTMAACANNASGSTTGAGAGAATVDASAPTVTIMVGGMSKQIYLPFMLAKQLGYYAKAGINVNLVDEPAGGDATQNMLAGQVQGVGGFYDHNIALQAQDKFSESVVSMLQIPGRGRTVPQRPQGRHQQPRRLHRPVLGITDTGSSTDFLTQYLFKKN